MRATVEKLEKNRVSLHIEVEESRVEEAIDQACRRLARKVNIPGFRRGRVPRAILERRLGMEALLEEALELMWPRVFSEAVKDTSIHPIDWPTVGLAEEFERGKPLQLRAEVEVKPEVALHQYKGIAAERNVVRVTDADVDEVLERLRQGQAQLVTSEHPSVEEGDYVAVDYTGFVDGEPFPGGAAKEVVVQVGGDESLPGLGEGLLGLERDDEREIAITLPERFGELAGREATFHVHLHEIKTRQVPELDDELAKDVSDFDTLDELRASILSDLESQANQRADAQLRNDLISEVSRQAELDVPEVLVDREVDEMINETATYLAMQGLDPRMFLQGEYLESMKERSRPEAEQRVRARLVMEAVAETEGIEVSAEEVEERLEQLVQNAGDNQDEVRAYYNEPVRRQALEESMRLEKVTELLVESAIVTEKVVDRPEDPTLDTEAETDDDSGETAESDEDA